MEKITYEKSPNLHKLIIDQDTPINTRNPCTGHEIVYGAACNLPKLKSSKVSPNHGYLSTYEIMRVNKRAAYSKCLKMLLKNSMVFYVFKTFIHQYLIFCCRCLIADEVSTLPLSLFHTHTLYFHIANTCIVSSTKLQISFLSSTLQFQRCSLDFGLRERKLFKILLNE